MKRRKFLKGLLLGPAVGVIGFQPKTEPELQTLKASGTWTVPETKPETLVVYGWGGAGAGGGGQCTCLVAGGGGGTPSCSVHRIGGGGYA